MPKGALRFHLGLDAALLSCNDLAMLEVATPPQEPENRMASTLSSMEQSRLTSQYDSAPPT
jgi:hypothetical protein